MTTAQAAKKLCKQGFSITKLRAGSKEPSVKGWLDKTIHEPTAVRWKGDCNIGIIAGTTGPSGKRLIILDVDVKNGALGAASLDRMHDTYRNFPFTAEALTPSGGRHFYLWVPADTPLVGVQNCLVAAGYPGIEVLGENHFAVAAPSVTPDGCYSWVVWPQEGIADAPAWLVGLLARPEPPEFNGTQRKAIDGPLPDHDNLLAEVIERFKVEQPGQRNDRMHRAVASLFSKGLDSSTITQVMVSWHQHYSSVIETEFGHAIRLLTACIKSCQTSIDQGKFILQGGKDHLTSASSLELPPESLRFLSLLRETRGAGFLSPLINKGGQAASLPSPQIPRTGRITNHEAMMVEALLIHCLYEQNKNSKTLLTIPMTNKQLQALMQKKFGIQLDSDTDGQSRQLRRLKDKFISKGSFKATKLELLEIVEAGVRGKASQYKITGLKAGLPKP